ncbi:hypothetical protein KIW84_065201 [Lathyrus oleraceus]|uniref:DUF7745 domain-containing protein n=1 Tax=Pisum sativum TaxID=3888 RepID=A0A9D4WDN5_PEA|nr:hypothetical protein KIW84_065201 [Pisum sativum]
MPMLEEYAHPLGILVSNKVPFSGLEEIPISHLIAEALHLKKSEIEAHWVKKGAIFEFLIYELALFPDIDGFVDVNAIRIFLIGNPMPTLLGDMYFYLHLRNSKGGETIVRCVPLMYKWFISHLPQTLTFMENKQCLSCGEFSNVPLIGTQGGINYNPALAHPQLGFPLRDKPNNTQLEVLFYQEGKDPQLLKPEIVHAWHNVHRKGRFELGPCNCVALEAYTLWVKKRALELKMPYDCERPMSMVVVEPLTLPKQDV